MSDDTARGGATATDSDRDAALEDVDRRLLALLGERAKLVLESHATGIDAGAATGVDAVAGAGVDAVAGAADAPRYRPEQEARSLRALVTDNTTGLPDAALQRIFAEVHSATRSLGRGLRIAYLGPEGTYSQAATDRHFGHAVEGVPERGIPAIFAAVESGRADFGVVPVENSTEGAVNHTLDLLMDTPLRICGEVRLRIQHRLLSRVGSLAEVSSVHAHPQSLAQCRRWLDEHLPGVPRVSESSNAAGARIAVDEPGAAAIAGEAAGERYALATLEAGIEDAKRNTTRFLVMGDRDVPPSGDDTTSLLLSAPHRPGGLRRMLEPFESAGLSMSRIESRPNRSGLWEYVFFIDFAGHRDDDEVADVLRRLVDELPLVRVLGSYPRAL